MSLSFDMFKVRAFRKALTVMVRWGLLFCCGGLTSVGVSGQQSKESPMILSQYLHEKNYAIRFVYNPPIPQTNVVTPTTFRQVERADPRYGDWSTDYPLGRTQWISPQEMRHLAEGLARLNLSWTESPKPLVFRKELKEPPDQISPWKVILPRHGRMMEIDVTCEAGSAVADVPAEQVCDAMKRLDGALITATAVYTFRGSRTQWGCKVPGYNPANRPERPNRSVR